MVEDLPGAWEARAAGAELHRRYWQPVCVRSAMNAPCSNCSMVGWTVDGLCPVCLMAPRPGHGRDEPRQESRSPEQLPGYDLLEPLGRGGMGVVYRARQHNPPREVALKKLRAGEQATPEERRRFVTEIDAAARVRHPSIVEIYDVSRPDEPPYFTMPLFPNTLRAELDQHRSPRDAATLIRTIARAVQHAHKRGVLHRDLKPDNILIDERGQPHVADFGLAKQVGDATLTAFGIGTPEYAAPEQLRNDRDAITTAVDQYSLGVMLYELLTGERPFRSNGDVLVLLRSICETEPPPPRALVPDLPRDLEAICLRSITRTPQERYDSVGAFADDLDRFLRGEPTVARPPGVVGRTRRFLWNHRLAAGLGGSALVLLAVIAGSALSLAHEQEHQLAQSTRDGYVHTTQAISSLVTQHLRRQPPAEYAAFAEVEDSQFRVIVHHPPSRVISLAQEMPRRLVTPVIVALAAWAAIFALGQRRIARRRSKQVAMPIRPGQASTVNQ